MSKMISVASGFQYSVNIGYDLSSNEKLKNVVCCKAGLFGKLFLRQSKTLTALLYSLAYSIIDHDTYHVPFHVFHNKYMD